MLKFLATAYVILLASSAYAGTVTGQVKNLDGSPLIGLTGFSASVLTRAGDDLVTNATSTATGPGVVPVVVTFTVTFDDSRLPTDDQLITVTLNADAREQVTLQGLDGKRALFQMDVIMPKQKVPDQSCLAWYPTVNTRCHWLHFGRARAHGWFCRN